jgi:hypothetical protein
MLTDGDHLAMPVGPAPVGFVDAAGCPPWLPTAGAR